MTSAQKGITRKRVGGSTASIHHSRLAQRRRKMRKRKISLAIILTVFLFIVTIIVLRQSFMIVNRITVSVPKNISSAVVLSTVHKSISGSYFYIIPYSSIVFLNGGNIRKTILQKEPTVAAISIERTGFNTINITLEPRTALSKWCGTVASSTPANTIRKDTKPSSQGQCFLFDNSGFLFQKISMSASSTASTTIAGAPMRTVIKYTPPLFPYTIYAPLSTRGKPYLNTIADNSSLSHIFDLARNIRIFNVTVSAIVLRGDEVDLFLSSGTRITYVLGKESSAFSLLSSVKKDISLSDESLRYVDLRFSGKVYFKKR